MVGEEKCRKEEGARSKQEEKDSRIKMTKDSVSDLLRWGARFEQEEFSREEKEVVDILMEILTSNQTDKMVFNLVGEVLGEVVDKCEKESEQEVRSK